MISATVGEGDAVARLFAERQRLEGWLAALEGRRAATPGHIYERVRGDYEGRLRGVLDELREHRSSVQAMVESMEQRLGALAAEEGRHQDDRAEAELRAAIGELEEEQSRAIVGKADEALAHIAAERGSITPELVRLREILASTDEAPVQPEPAAPAAPEPVVAERAPEPEPAAEPVAAEATPSPSAFDELEFLKSVVVEPRTAAPEPTREPAHASASTSRESGAISTARGMGSGSVPAFLRDVPSEQAKTLKCQECGTMNYPTEWYCERCGAELAAL
jgi:hypothetical protein